MGATDTKEIEMDRREARRQAHDIAATLIEQSLDGGRLDDSRWVDDQADHDRIEAALAEFAAQHRRRSHPA